MAEDTKDGVTPPEPKGEPWTPPTREEWEASQKTIKNKTEEADRHAKKVKAIEDKQAQEAGKYEELYTKTKVELDAVTADAATYRSLAEAELGEALKALPPEALALIPEELPIATRLRMAKAAKALLAKSTPVGTVSATGATSTSGSGKFGGYADEIEWARNDYPAYKKYRDSQPRR